MNNWFIIFLMIFSLTPAFGVSESAGPVTEVTSSEVIEQIQVGMRKAVNQSQDIEKINVAVTCWTEKCAAERDRAQAYCRQQAWVCTEHSQWYTHYFDGMGRDLGTKPGAVFCSGGFVNQRLYKECLTNTGYD